MRFTREAQALSGRWLISVNANHKCEDKTAVINIVHIKTKKIGKQVRQQACKMHTPPYDLISNAATPNSDWPTEPRPITKCALHLSVSMGVIGRSCAPLFLQYRGDWAFSREVMPPLPWLPASQYSPTGEKTCPDSRPTRMQISRPYKKNKKKLEYGPVPNMMAALPNIGGALCLTP